MLVDLLSAAVLLVAILLVAVAAYLAVLTLAAIVGRARLQTKASHPPRMWNSFSSPRESCERGTRRFAILIPAHNEERLIGRLLDSLSQLDYPAQQVDVYFVADHCSDHTAERAPAAGAAVLERFDDTHRAQGLALRWLIEQIHASHERYDAFIVFDADSVVEPNFLAAMDARLEAGSQVIQAYYSVLNTGESAVATLRFAALAAVHYLRPLGRSV